MDRLPVAGMTEADLATLHLLVADAIGYRREREQKHEDAECPDCERGDCATAREGDKRMFAYLEFRARHLGVRGEHTAEHERADDETRET
jgi:hypothetical protein